MHYPRCLDPESQDSSIEHPHKYEGGGCRLGTPGHCRECPYRGLDDARWVLVQRLNIWANAAQRWPSLGALDELFEKMPKDVQAILFPATEREWIEQEDRWGERANYYAVTNTYELIRELLREVHDLRRDSDR